MGLVYKKILSEDTLLGLWEISESVQELLLTANLSATEKEILSKKVSDKRKKEWLSARCLAKSMLPAQSEILYDKLGKPVLESGDYHISISHSGSYSAVYLNKESPVGVDIQKIKPDISKGIDYFLNNQEQLWVDETDFITLNILWSCKESVFKYVSSYELDIRNQIFCNSFEAKSTGEIEVIIRNYKHEILSIHYEVFEDYVLTRTL
ncbi:4'-phosphopantetheinyl transferase superfamily protein [Dyadobacter sp. CY345]|uniref:4'-phosphopantetheinyl transferase family protein n=1 Tax=Dyadobacter sp. CY345 TaxID=2909335 RepID=UPI001F333B8A|nr:4'-phosphopantetheinyl transferase family protein [Dyadobacter sp. CY345]MCF2447478.1 4'-phosphopantetheinyl transferase superfamily protein [Dyadobacter sp. CY345]